MDVGDSGGVSGRRMLVTAVECLATSMDCM